MAAEREARLAQLEACIGYGFERRELLELALTHRSFGKSNNERLEFLGDALLDLGIAAELYRRFPRLHEGDLSRLRANLVRGATLAQIGREFGLGEYLRIGKGEASSGGRSRDSIIADTVEAMLGAIMLDGGTEAALTAVSGWYGQRLGELDPGVSHKDAKTELQEYLQARRLELPQYQLLASSGADHELLFRICCTVPGLEQPIEGSGRSRRIAEQQSAREALRQLRARGIGT